MTEPGMVIVGAGECGARAAFALREEGFAGPVTLIGAEPHLPYERPPLSKQGMAADRPGMTPIAGHDRFAQQGIRLVLGNQARAIDRAARTVELAEGERVPYHRLLLATGAVPRRLPAAAASRHAVTLRTHEDAERIAGHLSARARITIVGGGFIGLELAAAAIGRDCRVTVIEALPRLLARAVPAEIAERIADTHRARGVEILTAASIEAIRDVGEGVQVTLADGRAIAAELLVVGIGALPATDIAAEAGLVVDNGIRVDATLASSDPDIFAAGDCCSFPLALYGGRRVRLEAWRNAQEQGALAARNMLGAREAHSAVPWFWSDQYDLTLQIAGLCDEGATTVRRDLGGDAFILFHLAADGRLVAASGLGHGNAVARDIRLAEMLIARRAAPDPRKLAIPDVKLKSLLAA
ncbi:ferredoxin reductase [Aquibium carbonis]|uniref:Ferredoxin reductase n=1 Tax=Aquibium carbonis TaxID=2495581 RepID=A0A3R9ZS52_9HYPH|nr:FAD-dependent oxidoreductase [Aquibium carbonis]RST86410.1 ferredoxin reductase [Aquibium carbonis]